MIKMGPKRSLPFAKLLAAQKRGKVSKANSCGANHPLTLCLLVDLCTALILFPRCVCRTSFTFIDSKVWLSSQWG